MVELAPKYEVIADDILFSIKTGTLSPGDSLLGFRKLGEKYDCHYHTARRAIKLLESRGYLRVSAGTGSCVLDPLSRLPLARVNNKLGVLLPVGQWRAGSAELLAELHSVAAKADTALDIRTFSRWDSGIHTLFDEFVEQACIAVLIPWLDADYNQEDLLGFVKACRVPVVLPNLVPGLQYNFYGSGESYTRDSDANKMAEEMFTYCQTVSDSICIS